MALLLFAVALVAIPLTARAGDKVTSAPAANPAGVAGLGALEVEVDSGDPAVTWRPYVELERGYDTNLDGFVRNEGSRFSKVEAGLRVTVERDNKTLSLFTKRRQFRYHDLDVTERWDFEAAAGLLFDLEGNDSLKVGGSYYRDSISLDPARLIDSFADYKKRGEDYRVRVTAKTHTLLNITEPRNPDNFSSDLFDIIRNAAFDYTKAEGQINVLGFTNYWLQPFFIYDYANLDYFHQAPDASLDRNARDQWGVAGVRLQFGQKLRVDLGGRMNRRDIDDLVISAYSAGYFDGRVVFVPTPSLKITGLLERRLREPSTSFSVVDDVLTYGAKIEKRIGGNLLLTGSLYYDRRIPVGDELFYNKYRGRASAFYTLTDNFEIFADFSYKRSDEEVFRGEYDGYSTSGGIRISF